MFGLRRNSCVSVHFFVFILGRALKPDMGRNYRCVRCGEFHDFANIVRIKEECWDFLLGFI